MLGGPHNAKKRQPSPAWPHASVRTLYLSASIVNAPLNVRLRTFLPADRFKLVLPQEFSPNGIPRSEYPRAIYERCIHEMDQCDAALLLLDAFGVDCACEAGWLSARSKPLIAVAQASCRFFQHWMVKGSISATICLDATIHEQVLGDPTLGSRPTALCERWEDLAGAIDTLLDSLGAGDMPAPALPMEGVVE